MDKIKNAAASPRTFTRLCISCEFPPMIGGQGTFLKNLWVNFQPEKNIILIPGQCRKYAESFSNTTFVFMTTVQGETPLRRLWRMCLVCPAVIINAIRYRPTEIHAGQLLGVGVWAFLLKFFFRIKYAVYCYGAELLEYAHSALLRRMVFLILKKADLIVTISRYSRSLISSLYCNSFDIITIGRLNRPGP